MSRLINKREQDKGRGRFLLGVFVLAWLNLAVQPCLMAMESMPEPVVSSAQSDHSGHASHSFDHNCDRCPPSLNEYATACASVEASDCSSVPDLNFDGRDGPAKTRDLPNFVAVAEFAMPDEFTIRTSAPPPLDCAALTYPDEPPLSIRFCVFLK